MRVVPHAGTWTFCILAETIANAFDHGWNLFEVEGVHSQHTHVMPWDYPYGKRECRITLHKSSSRPGVLQLFFTAPNGRTTTTVVRHRRPYVELHLTAGSFKIVRAQETSHANIERF